MAIPYSDWSKHTFLGWYSNTPVHVHQVPVPDWVCHIALSSNADFASTSVQFEGSSPVKPARTFRYDFLSEKTTQVTGDQTEVGRPKSSCLHSPC